jgi:hypothetical protein
MPRFAAKRRFLGAGRLASARGACLLMVREPCPAARRHRYAAREGLLARRERLLAVRDRRITARDRPIAARDRPIARRVHPSAARASSSPGRPSQLKSAAVLACSLALALGGSACASRGSEVSAPVPERREARSVAEFLAALPEGLRSHYVLMFQSRSPQAASYDAPRVILYGNDGRLVVAFGADSDAVDVMNFDEDTNSFVFHEVTFPNEPGRPAMAVSDANPERCRACHGTPLRPVWDSYPLWPGAYGESAVLPPSKFERDGYASFQRVRAEHPRYRYLVEHRDTAIAATQRRYRGEASLASNVELSELLGELNARSVAGELRASPGFESYRYALLAALSAKCGDATRFLPSPLRASFPLTYPEFSADSNRANAEQEGYKELRAQAVHRPSPSAPDDALRPVRYLAEEALGVATGNWTLALEKGTFDFTSSPRSVGPGQRRLFAEVAAPDQRVVDLFLNGGDSTTLCGYLEPRARSAARGAVAAPHGVEPAPVASSATPLLLGRCAGCHERGVGPPISFSHPAQLAKQLAMPAGTHRSLLDEIRFRLEADAGARRMPPVLNPPREERGALLSYLAQLAAQTPHE